MDRPAEIQINDAWQSHRRYVLDVAYRMLGDLAEAEDIVQEAFTRLMRADIGEIEDVRGWLVVVTSRLCLDHFRSARSRHETEPEASSDAGPRDERDPVDRITLDDRVRAALGSVLERLTPAERVVFVLHDVFRFSFDDVASIVGRSPAACRQLASRARRRVRAEAGPARFEVQTSEQQRVAERFIAACGGGDLQQLLEVLDPHVDGLAEAGGVIPGDFVRIGRDQVARNALLRFGPASGVTLVSLSIGGTPAAVVYQDGRAVIVLLLTIANGVIEHIRAIGDERRLEQLLSQSP